MAGQELRLYDDYVARMRRANATNLTEVALRLGIVGICSGAIALALRDLTVIVWFAIYCATTLLYVAWLRRQGIGITKLAYGSLLAFHTGIGIWFAALPVYFATQGDLLGLFVGYSAVCGLAMHNLTRRALTPHVAWCDMITMIMAGLAVAWQFVQVMPTATQGWVIFIVIVGLLGYYLHTYIDKERVLRKLEAKAVEERQTQKMQAVGQLTAGIAHDFNNILTVIRGNLDLHSAVEDPKERDTVLKEAREASEKAAHLVSQLLAFSRKSKITPKPRRASDTLHDFLALARRTLPATITLDVKEPFPDIALVADQTLLQNALLNAAVNARDAMGSAGGTLQIALHVDDAAPWPAINLPHRLYGRIVMTDTGPGVSESALEKLTDPFYTSKPVGQGSGLGLSMIKGFAEQSGGHLHLENAPERGLRLSLLLPAEEIAHDAAPTHST